MKKSKQSFRPIDPMVEDRARGAFAGDVVQAPGKRQRGRPQAPRDPPPRLTGDIEVLQFDADTIPVFCRKHRISPAFYYKLKLQGMTPDEMHLGRKRLISREARERWQ